MRSVRTLLVAAALLGGGTFFGACHGASDELFDAGSPAVVPQRVEVVAPAPIELAPVQVPAPPVVEPPPPPPPPFDAEAEARAREEAARAAFDAEWPLHGVAYHFLAQVRLRPDLASPIVGYLRRGSRFRAKEGLRGAGCARGWHEVVGGGFVCRGEGFMLGEGPQTFEPSPMPAALEDALPYPYAYVGREDAPQYWRVPSVDEERSASALFDRLRSDAAARAARAASAADAGVVETEPSAEPDLEAPPGIVVPEATDAGVAGTPLPEYLRMRMLRGFYVSIDREQVEGDRRFFRTVRGSYVPADVLVEAVPPTMRGVVLGGEWQPPLGFVYRRGVRALLRDTVSGAFEQADALEPHLPLLLDPDSLERRGTRFRVALDGRIVRESALRVMPVIARPAGVADDERWVHVDLSEQTLVAYEGDRPVFTTLVSTGRAGFETPIGTFRIASKHVSATMDDPDSATDAYSIEDVPWTMYFEGSYALHGAFWHDSFGHVRSHGCVNLAPADARWIFQWTMPQLPPGWHGVIAMPRRPGSVVHVTE